MDNVPQFIESNIPDSIKEISAMKTPLWIIMNYITGCTLMKLIDKWKKDNSNVQPIDSIQFCQKLLETVKYLHSKGVIHRDIKPSNIIIECDKHDANRICGQCKLTLIDYGLVYMRTETNDPSCEKYRSAQPQEVSVTTLYEDIGHSWCRVPQLAKSSDIAIRQMTELEKYEQKQLRRSPTADASNLQERVEAYLMDTFDKGFGFPDIQWTVEQLKCRLNLILEMMQNTSEVNTTVNIQESIIQTSDEHLITQLKQTELL
ncbi:unnamed protein product, partial [Rotaria sordida]